MTFGAVEPARAIAARDLTAREAVQAGLERISAVNPTLNAVTIILAGEALTTADAADAADALLAGSVPGRPSGSSTRSCEHVRPVAGRA